MPRFTTLMVLSASATIAFVGFQVLTSQQVPQIPTAPSFQPDLASDLEPVDADRLRALTTALEAARDIKTLSASAGLYFQRKRALKLSAEVFCERPRRSRIRLRSWVGLECDVGSNDTEFWFWFKRRDPNTVFYGPYEEAAAAGLLDPLWLAEAVGPFQVNLAEVRTGRQGGYLLLVRPEGDDTKVTAVDEATGLVRAHYRYDADRQLVAFSEILAYVRVGTYQLPRTVAIGWPAQQTYSLWGLEDHRVNEPLDPAHWARPAQAKPLAEE